MSEPEVAEKRVSWAELFFDLVFVFAITQVSALLHQDVSWTGLARALVVFVPIYWAWVGTSIQANTHDVSRPGVRLAIFAVALSGLFMALAVPDAFGDRGVLFGFAYWAARLVLGGLLPGGLVRRINPITVSMVLTGPLLLVGGLLHGSARETVWAVAALIDLSSPTLLRKRLRTVHYDAAHLTERFGLFVLIALGESVVAIGAPAASSAHLGAGTLCAVAAAFAFICGLWWVYFHFAADAMRHAMATAQVQLDITRHVLSYGHLAFIASIIAVAVGLSEVVTHPGQQLDWGAAALLFGGTVLYLANFGYTRWKMFHLVSTTRLTAAAAVLALVPFGRVLPGLAGLTLLAAAVAALNLVEYLRVNQTGWRALLRRRVEAA